MDLFYALKARLGLDADALSFEAFPRLTRRPDDLGAQPADLRDGERRGSVMKPRKTQSRDIMSAMDANPD